MGKINVSLGSEMGWKWVLRPYTPSMSTPVHWVPKTVAWMEQRLKYYAPFFLLFFLGRAIQGIVDFVCDIAWGNCPARPYESVTASFSGQAFRVLTFP